MFAIKSPFSIFGWAEVLIQQHSSSHTFMFLPKPPEHRLPDVPIQLGKNFLALSTTELLTALRADSAIVITPATDDWVQFNDQIMRSHVDGLI